MNKDNAKDFLPLVQAMAEGKEVQYKTPLGEWGPAEELAFTMDPSYYRIKPEPQTVWAYRARGHGYHPDGKLGTSMYPTRPQPVEGWECVEFIEVLPE